MTASTPSSPARIRVIACGMIAREVLAVNEQLGFDHIDLACLPAEYHHYPEKIAPAMDKAIETARAEGFEHVFVGYADCGTGGELDKVCKKHGVERIAGPHCFSFYAGNAAFAAEAEELMTTFFITDFLARQFEAFMVKPLGLDRHPDLKEMYFANYTAALYLAQTEDPELERRAREIAAYLGLEYKYRYTGYGDLAPALASLKP
ncbi:MAG: DUF1638 domain-containing protein [Nitratireductor sp.]|nr:DUF1638 domain-containing protein [Nitratireductor sp.]